MGLTPPFGLAAGSRVTVDSAPLIYFLESHPVYAPKFAQVFEANATGLFEVVISTIAIAEVLAGPLKEGNEAVADRYRRILSEWEIISVDAEVAALAARLRVRYKLRLADAIHVATALSTNSDALVTHDRDFSGIAGIRIIDGRS